MRVLSKTVFFILLIIDTVIFSAIIYLDTTLSEEYKIKRGDMLDFDTAVPMQET